MRESLLGKTAMVSRSERRQTYWALGLGSDAKTSVAFRSAKVALLSRSERQQRLSVMSTIWRLRGLSSIEGVSAGENGDGFAERKETDVLGLGAWERRENQCRLSLRESSATFAERKATKAFGQIYDMEIEGVIKH